MILTHSAFINLYNKDNKIFNFLLDDTNTISKLSSKILKISKSFDKFSYKDEDKLKGDIFEIFAEAFFLLLSSDNRIGVYNYKPAPTIEDYGVDGFGIGMDTNPLTVQVKFRSDATSELKQEDIKQFALQSIVNYNVDKDTLTNMIVFTNAKGLHWFTESRVFAGRIRSIGYDQLSLLTNNNYVFWRNFKDLIDNTIRVRYQ